MHGIHELGKQVRSQEKEKNAKTVADAQEARNKIQEAAEVVTTALLSSAVCHASCGVNVLVKLSNLI